MGSFLSKLYFLVRGTPQGGILSPLLFAICYNLVGSSLLGSKYKLFADDLVYYIFGFCLQTLIKEATAILETLQRWCNTNSLEVNYAKTQFMVFSKKSSESSANVPIFQVGDNVIEYVASFKYLGVHLDSNLTFNPHYDHVLSKISSAIGCIQTIKRYLSVPLFSTIVNSFVYSVLDYCLPVYCTISETHKNVIQSKLESLLASYFYPTICNRFRRFYNIHSNIRRRTIHINYNSLFEKCNLLKFRERIEYFNCVSAFNFLYTPYTPKLSGVFVRGKSYRCLNSSVPIHDCEFYTKSAYYQNIISWNQLNTQTKEMPSLYSFKLSLDSFLLSRRVCSRPMK